MVSLVALALFAAGCGSGGDGGSDGASGSGGSAASGGTSGSGGSGGSGENCTESPLFAPRSFGSDGADIIRDIEVDETTRDVYFITTEELFVVRADSSEATRLAGLPAVGDHFWLTDGSVLLPGFAPNEMTDPAVLLSTDPAVRALSSTRAGSEAPASRRA